ncbi:hypothetical protein Drorol1_Dr00005349 [Drosera rotundifolia]
MLGTKRRNVALRDEPDESAVTFQSKRVVVDPPFQIRVAESSQQQIGATAPLDLGRAESSRQHVRALNTQFASWVQSQLKNHPDELWEDGIRDYLEHASNILEKFSDVVDWLKANSAKHAGLPTMGTQTKAENFASGNMVNGAKLPPIKPVFSSSIFSTSALSTGASASSSQASLVAFGPSFGASWSSGVTSAAQASAPATSTGLAPSWSSEVTPPDNTSKIFTSSNIASFWSTGVSSTNETSTTATTPPLFAPSWSSGVSASSHASTVSTFPNFVSAWSSGASSSSQSTSHGTSPTFASPWSPSSFSNTQIPSPVSTASFAPSWSAGAFSTSQTPFNFGNQSVAPSNDEATDDADGENDERPSSPSLKRNEEEGITVVHETKCKLYVKSSDPADPDPWKDKGMGQLVIKCKDGAEKGTKDSKPVILVRNDVGKVLLNASLYPGIKTNPLKKTALAAIFHTLSDSGDDNQVVARTFLIRTKNEVERNKLAEVIEEYAPAA